MDRKMLETAEGRAEAKRKCLEEIKELNEQKEEYLSEVRKLEDDNKDKISERTAIKKKYDSQKSSGKTCITFGVILAAVCLCSAFALGNMLVACAAGVIGVLLIVCGVRVSSKAKGIYPELEKANAELADFDCKVGELNSKIKELDDQIQENNNDIAEIDLKEKYAKVDEWIESISVGHVGIYVSGEVKYLGSHEEPKPKKYSQTSGLLMGHVADVCVNDMVYGKVEHSYTFGRDLEIFEIDEEGTSKLNFEIYYHIGSTPFTYTTEAKPVKFGKESKFCWFHVETCTAGDERGTVVYGYAFDDFETFLKETGITKDEIMEKFLRNR